MRLTRLPTRVLLSRILVPSLGAAVFGCMQHGEQHVPFEPYLGQTPPDTTPEVFAPGIISNAGFHLHSSVAISPDGNEIYFTKIVFEPETQGTICRLTWDGSDWSGVQTAPFSGVYNDDSPVFSPDGTRLYFTSTRPVNAPGSSGNRNIWFVEKSGDGWGGPNYTGDVLNTEHSDFRLSFAGDGTIYLSSDRDDPVNGTFDIFTSHLVDGRYAKPEKMGEAVTTPVTEQIGYVAPDESHLVFYRHDRANTEETGLYISFRGPDGSWTRGVNMGERFNAPPEAVTQAASLSPDGGYLFFLRRRHEAIYWVDARAIEELEPYRR